MEAYQLQLIEWIKENIKTYLGSNGDSDGDYKIYPSNNFSNSELISIPAKYLGDSTQLTPWMVPTLGPTLLLTSGSGMDCWYALLSEQGKVLSSYSISIDSLTQEDNEVLGLKPVELVLFLLMKDKAYELPLGGYPLNFSSLLPWNKVHI